MKKQKKNARKQLEKFSTIFTQLGLVLTLFVVFIVLEHQTVKSTSQLQPVNEQLYEDSFTFNKPIIVKKLLTKSTTPKKKTSPKNVLTPPVITKDDVVESVIDVPVEEPVVDLATIKQEKEDEIINTVDEPKPMSINNVQKTPVFKGCEGLSEDENRKCFERKIQQHVQQNFNAELAQDVGLRSGKYKIFTQFVIDKSGNVTDIKIRAPHTKLKNEAGRVVLKIPQFQPGKQNNKEVKVKYILPITFKVE